MSKKYELRSFKPEIRAASDAEPSKLVGYAATFNNPTDVGGYFTEVIEPGCFVETIRQDNIVALVNHDVNLLLGRNVVNTLLLREDQKGLYFEIDLPNTSVGKDIAVLVERGDISECSFAFIARDESWDYENDIRTLRKVQLFDISVVTNPQYTNTSVSARSAKDIKNERPAKPVEARENSSAPETQGKTEDAGAIVGIDLQPIQDFLEVLRHW